MEQLKTFYTSERKKWREWLSEHFETENEIWFVFPMKESGEASLSYNDAVEEALCFGWIDSTIKHIDPSHRAQHFSPRKPGSEYSRANIERLIWLNTHGMLHCDIRNKVIDIINAPYLFPDDIIAEIKNNSSAWEHYLSFPEPYKRIRVAYIDAARKRPGEFRKRLDNFLRKTSDNRLITGFGGIEKYYNYTD